MRRTVRRRKRIKRIHVQSWWPRQMDKNGWPDMEPGFPTFASQCTTQYPRQQSQQEIDCPNKKAEGMFVHESIKVFQSRRFQFECFYLPRLHDGLLYASTAFAAGTGLWVPMMAFCCR